MQRSYWSYGYFRLIVVIFTIKIVSNSDFLKCLDNAINKIGMAKLKFREEEGRRSTAKLSKTSDAEKCCLNSRQSRFSNENIRLIAERSSHNEEQNKMSEEDFSPLTEFKERLARTYERELRPQAQREAEEIMEDSSENLSERWKEKFIKGYIDGVIDARVSFSSSFMANKVLPLGAISCYCDLSIEELQELKEYIKELDTAS